MQNYDCPKCSSVTKTDGLPPKASCPNGGEHNWQYNSEVGDDTYRCDKCEIIVYSNGCPKLTDCSKGGSHEWVLIENARW